MVTLALRAASNTSSSRIEPPGCTMALTPASMRICAPSANGRILKVAEPPKSKLQFRQIDGGLLVQSTDLIDATGDMHRTGCCA